MVFGSWDTESLSIWEGILFHILAEGLFLSFATSNKQASQQSCVTCRYPNVFLPGQGFVFGLVFFLKPLLSQENLYVLAHKNKND